MKFTTWQRWTLELHAQGKRAVFFSGRRWGMKSFYEALRTIEEARKQVSQSQTKDCKNCESPVDVDGPDHASAGDCRAAQRKVIRELRKEVEHLRGVKRERETMTGELRASMSKNNVGSRGLQIHASASRSASILLKEES